MVMDGAMYPGARRGSVRDEVSRSNSARRVPPNGWDATRNAQAARLAVVGGEKNIPLIQWRRSFWMSRSRAARHDASAFKDGWSGRSSPHRRSTNLGDRSVGSTQLKRQASSPPRLPPPPLRQQQRRNTTAQRADAEAVRHASGAGPPHTDTSSVRRITHQ